MKDTEAKTKIHKAVRKKEKGTKAQPQASTTPQMPFQESPLHNQGYRDSDELPKSLFIKKGRQTQSQGKGQCDNKFFSQQFGISFANTRFRFKKRTPIYKKPISGNKNTSGPSSRKIKMLSKVLGKINQGLKHSGYYTSVSDTLQKKTLSKDQKILVNQQISDMLKKGAIRECQPYPNQFLSTLF